MCSWKVKSNPDEAIIRKRHMLRGDEMNRTKGLLIVLIMGVALLVGTPAWSNEDSLQKAIELNQEVMRLYQQGRYAEAIPHAEKALTIYEKALGPEHPYTALSLNNLAELYGTMSAYDKAEPLYRRSLAIHEKALGPEHPSTALSLNNLAGLYYTMGAYDKAEPLYRRSLAIHEKALGPDHPDTATSLNNLATLYTNMGAYDKAEPLYRRSLAIHEKALGPEHPSTALSLNNLALLYAARGRSGEALTLMERSQESDRRQIEQILGFAPEAQQTQFLATRENNFFAYISLIRQRFPDNPKAIRNALDIWLARKGILLEAQKRIQDVLAAGDNPQAQEIFAKLIGIRQELARLVLGVSDTTIFVLSVIDSRQNVEDILLNRLLR